MKDKAKKRRWTVKTKLFVIMGIIFTVYAVFLPLFGAAFFERLYVLQKNKDLKNGIAEIDSAIGEENLLNDAAETLITDLENQNIRIFIFTLSDTEVTPLYYTKEHADYPKLLFGELNKAPTSLMGLMTKVNELYAKGTFDKLDIAESYMVEQKRYRSENIQMLFRANERLFIYAETPKTYIAETAMLAVRFTAIASLIIFGIGLIVIYTVAGKVSQPIRKIQVVADKISNMDFSERCEITSNDEIGMLAESINHMSDALYNNIETLQKANEFLKEDLHRKEQTEQMRKNFIANVSHDFKTPLTLIISYAEFMKQSTSDQNDRETLDIIMEEGQKLTDFVNLLLKLSEMESGIVSLNRGPFPITDLIDAVISKQKILLEREGVQVQVLAKEPLVVDADYFRMEQVMFNLLENAIKYSNGNKDVLISVTRMETNVQIEISNPSEPLAPEHVENLFDSFYRTDKSRNRRSNSYGLGLAVVKAVMEMHEAPYGARYEEGRLVIWFLLPAVDFEEISED